MPPHSTNIIAFRDCDKNEAFYRLYTLLVATEIALKDRLGAFPNGHDLDALAQRVIVPMATGVRAQLNSLTASLAALVCTFGGASAPVNPAKYPNVRYIRHAKDGFPSGSSDAQIQQALRDAQQLVAELSRVGVVL